MLTLARILLFVQCVLIAAALGAVAVFILVMALGALTGSSNINGGLAMGAAGMMPIGGVIGAALGAWLGWRAVTRWSRRMVLGAGFGLLALATVIAGGWWLTQELTDGNPYAAGKEPTVLIEWRLPGLVPHNKVQPVYRYTMRSTYMDWTLTSHWDDPFARDEDGRTILRFRGIPRWRVDGRIFQLWQFPDHDNRITVDLGLPRDPKPQPDYGPWQTVAEAPGHAFRTRTLAPE